MKALKQCFSLKNSRKNLTYEDQMVLASETPFSINEVEALYNLFKKLSSSVADNGYIDKKEFQLALLHSRSKKSLFTDRIFDLFDVKGNGVIDFGEFVRSLSIFHPNTSEADKIAFAFRLYDLRQTGYIEREELKEMVLAVLEESEIEVTDDVIESIVLKTLTEADLNGDGKIDQHEWKEYVGKNPPLLKNMTLPYLKELTVAFPSFILNSGVPD